MEIIEISTKESETTEGLSKSEFKELLSMATKDSYFIFDWTHYKQIDGVAMGPPLDPTLANAFLVYYEKNGWKAVLSNIDHFTIEGTLMINLLY